eukprot:761920-Hanusia_phi.AAC.1
MGNGILSNTRRTSLQYLDLILTCISDGSVLHSLLWARASCGKNQRRRGKYTDDHQDVDESLLAEDDLLDVAQHATRGDCTAHFSHQSLKMRRTREDRGRKKDQP